MYDTIINLELEEEADDNANRAKRRHDRRDCDHCVTVINGKLYPVKNWSQSGLLIFSDPKTFAVNKEIDVVLKFKLSESVLDVTHKARVVRKAYDRVALEFLPLTRAIQKAFHTVIEDMITAKFVDSQKV